MEQEGPVFFRQLHAYLSLEFGKLALGKRIRHDPLVPQCTENLAGRRACTGPLNSLAYARPPLISHAQTVRAATDTLGAGSTATAGTARRHKSLGTSRTPAN